MFVTAELTELRADQTSTMDLACVISTQGVAVSDGAGGFTDGTATTVSVACRVGPPSTDEREVASRLSQALDAVLTLPWGTAVPATGSIAVGGRTYQVEGTNDGQSYATAVRVRASEVA